MTPRSAEDDLRLIREVILPQITAGDGTAPSILVQGPIASSPQSRLYRVVGTAPGGSVSVKFFLDGGSGAAAPQAASAHHAALTKMVALGSEAAILGSPRPLALFAGYGAVAAEWIDGDTLSEVLIRGSGQRACAQARQAGMWLAALHRSSGPYERPVNTGLLIASLDSTESKAGTSAPAAFADGLALLRRTLEPLRRRDVPWGLAHGDFKPDNLIVSGERLNGIDFTVGFDGPVLYDAAQFLNHAALLLAIPRHYRHLGLGQKIEEAFKQGYMQDGNIQVCALSLAWFRLYGLVQLFADRRSWSVGLKAQISGWLLLRAIRGQARTLARVSEALPPPAGAPRAGA